MEQQCLLCKYESDSRQKLSKHILHTHKLKIPDYLIKVKYNGESPLCSCGCGTKTNYMPTLGDFSTYIKKHLHVIQKGKTQEEIFGNMNSPQRIKAISDARKIKFASGEYDHIIKCVSKKRSNKIKNKISNTHKEKWTTGNIGSRKHYNSKLEDKFQVFLDLLDINYIKNLYAKEIKAFYDFYIPKHNTIIEIDGDFWHCNPNSKYALPECKSQQKNLIRDEEKNNWAKENGYNMIRIWEYDIINNIGKIKEILNGLK